MALIALCSAKGSPGVTTTGLAFCLSWYRRTLLAELDPAGGDLLATFLQSRLKADRGLEKLNVADFRDRLAEDLWHQLIDLDPPHGHRLLLPGLTDPARGGSLPPWERLTEVLAGLETLDPAYDVIADCGRIATVNSPMPLILRADVVLLVVRNTIPSLSAVAPCAAALHDQLREHGGRSAALGLLVVAEGPYRPAEITRELRETIREMRRGVPELTIPVVAVLPYDERTATAVNRDGQWPRRSRLQRAAADAEQTLWNMIAAQRGRYRGPVAHLPTRPEAAHA